MDDAALTKLLSPTGWGLLNAMPPYDEKLAMAMAASLRKKGVDADLVAAVLTQSRLRKKGKEKFGDFADGMLFTPHGLEQATRLSVAARHAQRFTRAGLTHIADLTCGIGADSMAFAGVGLRILATDIDEMTAAIATVNLRHFPDAQVRMADGLELDLAAEGIDGVYADPARRTRSGLRIFDPRAYEPALDRLWALRDQVPAVGIKIGPGIPHSGLPEEAETQWVSVDGDVVEAGLWFGPLAPSGPGRSVLILGTSPGDPSAIRSRELAPQTMVDAPEVGELGTYLFEPDGAVIRSGHVATAARELGGRLIDPTIAYITADLLTESDPTRAPLARGYRVLDVFPFGLKRLRTYLRERNIGRLAIKKRGTAVVPEQLRRQLALNGEQEGTIVLTRIAGAQHVIVVEPLSTS